MRGEGFVLSQAACMAGGGPGGQRMGRHAATSCCCTPRTRTAREKKQERRGPLSGGVMEGRHESERREDTSTVVCRPT
ncbi:hypothetical protein E2C01_019209 [Portunus trituberculatus]|uniref:Uncharacterized protein n=1 Tax=Portunus trituberculatus TaxID=210409 RepID=A0A5B7DY89_PORTR|nr:hypothetical protein [Portunus trituberculatus]